MEARTHDRPITLVWIDARVAHIVRWKDDAALIEHIESDVPSHRRSSGHVRHDPSIRPSGGGGSAATAGEPRRLEHMARFLETVAAHLPEADLELIGPGTTHEHLARVVRDTDRRGVRHVNTVASDERTEPQLVARLRHLVGHDPRRSSTEPLRRLA